MTQAKEEFEKFSLGPISLKKDLSGKIATSTIQSFSKIPFEEYCDKFDIVIIDEAHHCSKEESQYHKVLTHLLSPIRIGLTATPKTDEKKEELVSEGLLGPIIGQFTLDEAEKAGILAKVKLKLIAIPELAELKDLRSYHEIYDEGICNYRTRNRIIIEEIKKLNKEGLSTLTYVTKIEHGERLLTMAENLGVETIFVEGATEGDKRSELKKSLQEKRILNVIATVVWKEGINVPSLNTIIVAGGGLKERVLLQTIGRGLRKDGGKDSVLIIDFIDCGKYLSIHCCKRLAVYIENGWL
jgi:superfamily II DNA or RNA helicase